MPSDLTIDPDCRHWRDLINRPASGELAGVGITEWRRRARAELGLPTDRPIAATGHQTLLWHPGILVKYLAVEAVAGDRSVIAVANLVVDQHTGDFGRFDVPVRGPDGGLAARPIRLTEPREGVPMVGHAAFEPPPMPTGLRPALPSVEAGIGRILSAVSAHRDAANAARQMAAALDDLMSPWITPMPAVGSSDLIETSLGRAVVEAMAADPQACAARYNDAVRALPEAGIPELAVTDDRVELPLWRVGADGRRGHADDADARRWLDGEHVELLPRALLLTALVRLAMCDLFVHGTGGANYDRAMERWLREWLGVEAAPKALATATLRLPLAEGDAPALEAAVHAARRAWHDPANAGAPGGPSPPKQVLLAAVEAAPRGSRRRRESFFRMHSELQKQRYEHAQRVEAAEDRLRLARRHAAEAPVARRRDWAFPLYPSESIDELACCVRSSVSGAERSTRV